ncbi:hypothetical protein SAMN05880574_102117 [Chryseobacterium sp. RU37D]|nr:hypothetical protein SAMN05880574_102117 [Chryseobacterium sp. RU37D]
MEKKTTTTVSVNMILTLSAATYGQNRTINQNQFKIFLFTNFKDIAIGSATEYREIYGVRKYNMT